MFINYSDLMQLNFETFISTFLKKDNCNNFSLRKREILLLLPLYYKNLFYILTFLFDF